MPKITICIDVSEMDKGIKFYTQVLGCELIKEGTEFSELRADNTTLYLAEKPAGSNPLPAGEASRSYERHWTPVHLDFVVPDLDQCLTTLLEFGGVKEGENSGDWGSIAFCADPFGNGFCVMQHNT